MPNIQRKETFTEELSPGWSDLEQSTSPKRLRSGSANPAVSRDEMNLAEFPLTVLSTRTNPSIKTLEFRDTQTLKNGETVEREWIITGADKFGLPTATDDDVVLGLIRLSMNQGFRERKVYFTRYELLKILKWSTEGRNYTRLTKSLDRLSGVRIRSTNAFFDNSLKAFQTCNFGIIDAYEINNERGVSERGVGESFSGKKLGRKSALRGSRRELTCDAPGEDHPSSFFTWSEMLFSSFQSGFIKKLDMELYFALQSAVSRRLYRYLDKHFYYRSVFEKPLTVLAFEKLGVSRSYRFISQLRQQIEPAAEELKERGFLESFEIIGRGDATVIRFVAASKTPRVNQKTEQNSGSQQAAPEPKTLDLPRKEISKDAPQRELIEALVTRGLTMTQAIRLLSDRSAAEFEQIEKIITYYDSLVAQGDTKVFRNRIGFLYRAVEQPLRFVIPAQFGDSGRRKVTTPERSRSRREIAGTRPELRIFRAAAPTFKASRPI